jgi:hypothetical protein
MLQILNINFNFILLHFRLVLEVVSSFQVYRPIFCMNFSYLLYVLHVSPTSLSLIRLPYYKITFWRAEVLEQTSYFQYVPTQTCITLGHLIMRQLVWLCCPVCSLYFRRNVSHARYRCLENVACVPKGA